LPENESFALSFMPLVCNLVSVYQKHHRMKSSRSTNNKQSKQGMSHKPKPEIRDDMDSRKQKEKGYKGPVSKKPAKKKKK
jgi:hypothetical protein